MPSPPPGLERDARSVGILLVAVGAALLVLATIGGVGTPGDDTAALVQSGPEASAETRPTVMAEVLDRTTLPGAPPASATAFDLPPDDTGVPIGRRQSARAAGTGGTDPTIAPPVSVTSPRPPRTTTTTRPTTTTAPPTPTTTTEPPTTTTTEDTTTTTGP